MLDVLFDQSGGWLAASLLISATISAIAFVFVGAALTNRTRARYMRRLETVRGRFTPGLVNPISSTGVRRHEERTFMDTLVKRYLPRPEKLAIRLSRTGRNLTIGRYATICLIVALVFGGIGYLWFERSLGLSLLSGLGAGLALPHQVIGYLINRRQRKFTEKLPEGIDVMARGLKAGLPVTETINAVGVEAAEPVRSIFQRISDLVKVGDPLEDAIEKVAREVDTPELKFLAITLSVQKETGGNLGETLENLSEILRKRRQMKLKIRAVSSEARASAYIIGSLPFVMFMILYVTNQSYVMTLFHDPRGHVLLAIGLFSMFLGAAVMFKMVRFEI